MLWLFMLVALPWDLFSQVFSGQTYVPASKDDVVALFSNSSGLQDAMPTSGRRLQNYTNGDDDYDNEDLQETIDNAVAELWHAILSAILVWLILSLAACITPCVILCLYKQKVHDKRGPLTPYVIQKDASGSDSDSVNATDILEMKFKLFGCFEDMDVCLHGYFCSTCRVADTWGTAKVFDFIAGIFVYLLVSNGAIMVFCLLMTIESPLFPKKERIETEKLLFVGNATEEALIREEQEAPMWTNALLLLNCLVAFAVQAGLFGLLRSQLRKKLGGGIKDNKVLLKDALIWGCCPCCAAIQEARVVDERNGVHVSCCCKLEQTGGNQLVGEATVVAR